MPWIIVLTKFKKEIVWAIIIICALLFYFYVIKKSDQQKAINKIKVDKSKVTISNSDAALIADNLLQAMNGWGTDENAIINSLVTLNGDDLLLVIKAFGTKQYGITGEITNWTQKQLWGEELNLMGWLKQELSDSTMITIKALFDKYSIPF